ncbi:MAG: peroxiredoxin [Egibacteraceae bacterium]
MQVGDVAVDFTLLNQDGRAVTLSGFRGQRSVLLVFYPLAFSHVCSGEMCQVREDLSHYQNDDTQVLAVSVDSVHALKAWADAEGFAFPLLSDFWPHGAVAQAYGVFDAELGFANRGTFLIDRGGVVRFTEVNHPLEPRVQAAWQKALADLTR